MAPIFHCKRSQNQTGTEVRARAEPGKNGADPKNPFDPQYALDEMISIGRDGCRRLAGGFLAAIYEPETCAETDDSNRHKDRLIGRKCRQIAEPRTTHPGGYEGQWNDAAGGCCKGAQDSAGGQKFFFHGSIDIYVIACPSPAARKTPKSMPRSSQQIANLPSINTAGTDLMPSSAARF